MPDHAHPTEAIWSDPGFPDGLVVRVDGRREVPDLPGCGCHGLVVAGRRTHSGFARVFVHAADGSCRLEGDGAEVAETAVATGRVVEPFGVVEDRRGQLGAGLPVATVQELGLQGGEEALGEAVVKREVAASQD